MFSENDPLTIALILAQEEEEKVVKNEPTRHGKKSQEKGNF